MPRFLYLQDGHAQGKNSINRIGDYFSDWLKKFDELLKIAKKNKVEAILDGGDLLHSPEPSYKVLDEIADRVEKTTIPIYSLFGNHASLYHSVEHSKYTGLAHLQRRSSNFKYLNVLTGKDFTIAGLEYQNDVEDLIRNKGFIFSAEHNDKWKIALVHAFISPKPFPYANHVVCDDITTNADLVLVAHYHSVWEKKVGKTQYLDIGCFGRNSVTEANIVPSCVLLDTKKRSYEIIPIKCAKKGSEVFDLTKLSEIKENKTGIEDFVKSLESTIYQGQKIEHTITQFAKQENIEKEVKDCILNKIEELKNG